MTETEAAAREKQVEAVVRLTMDRHDLRLELKETHRRALVGYDKETRRLLAVLRKGAGA